MAGRHNGRGNPHLLDANTARPPSRSLVDERVRPKSSPRVMLQPLQPPNSLGFGAGSSYDEKEYMLQLKQEIRLLAGKVVEYATAVETDHRMADSSSLLRRPLTPGSARWPGTAMSTVGQIAGNVDTFIDKATAGKSVDQAKTALLELLLTVLEDAQRCTLMLTDKRAPNDCNVPAPSTASGRMGSRIPVTEALMERALHLHGAIRPTETAERTRPTTAGLGEPLPLRAGDITAVSADVVEMLLNRLADLHEHLGSIAEGKRDPGENTGGKLLHDLEAANAVLMVACSQHSDSKISDAAVRVQGEARNATLAVSTAMAIRGAEGGSASEGALQRELLLVRDQLADACKDGDENSQSESKILALQKQVDDRDENIKRLQCQVQEMSRSAPREKNEDARAVAKDLVSVAKTTALEASNAELSHEVKQLKVQNARLKAQHHVPDVFDTVGRPSTSAVMGRPGTSAALSTDELRQEWLTLRGELGVARSQLATARQDKAQLETRLRSEKEKLDDLTTVCQSKDELIAHLRSELRSLERLSNASGNADSFEAVLAEELHTMRESFEQKIKMLKEQIERDNLAFSRERREMRENYDKDAKAMKRQIEILQAKTGDYGQLSEPMTTCRSEAQTMSFDD